MNNICDRKKCTGCGACYNVCPQNAIEMKFIDGFLSPVIDEKKCINCNLCTKTCPALNIIKKNIKCKNVIAAYNKDKNIRDTSSSGGVFVALAKYIIKKQGFVFGAEMQDDLYVKHIKIDTEHNIKKLQGSKYVQSDTNVMYKEVKRLLQSNKLVLYSGVPCQIAGLYNYLKENPENLYTCEVLCHGGASPVAFQKQIQLVSKMNSKKVSSINFRYKTEKRPQNLLYEFSDGTSKIITDPMTDYYYQGFQSGVLLRDSCFKCQYVGTERCADITLGDFWGFKSNGFNKPDNMAYPSLVMLNTKKAEKIWKAVSSEFNYTERPIEECIHSNITLIRPLPKNSFHNLFFKELEDENYENLAKKYLIRHLTWKDHIKNLIGPKLTKKMLKILRR